jgi:A/G-specific adenine glycosylase
MHWHKHGNTRTMPWKGEKDPYRIWLSEIILQQTRVEQGLSYYQAFIKKYPTVAELATAKDDDVFKLWEGLGYYSRCRNLLATARIIHQEHQGQFPTTYDTILSLKGIGPYTAAAIASFAYGLPHAVVDGNVFRVIARCFGITDAIDTTVGKQTFKALADNLLFKKDSAAYNQAIMDFGATICTPKQPLCSSCPLKAQCVALQTNQVNNLPVKEKKLVKKSRWFTYYIVEHQQKCLVRQRTAKDIWQNLFEFLLVEGDAPNTITPKEASAILSKQFNISSAKIQFISALQTQQLTHQNLTGRFVHASIEYMPAHFKTMQWVSKRELAQLAFPRFITRYLEEEQHQINLF